MEKALSSLRYLQIMAVVTTKNGSYGIHKCQNGGYEVNDNSQETLSFETSEQVVKFIGKPDQVKIIYADPYKEEIVF
jgi:hypothetical protein